MLLPNAFPAARAAGAVTRAPSAPPRPPPALLCCCCCCWCSCNSIKMKSPGDLMRRLNCLGLKCAICCCILSTWGIIQLGTMGVLFHTRSIALLDDVPEADADLAAKNLSLFYIRVDEGYNSSALNCWIGAAFYCTFLVFSLCQCAMNYWEIQNDNSKRLMSPVF